MKTRIQASSHKGLSIRTSIGSNWKSLFAGIYTNVAAFPSGFIYFIVYETLKGKTERIFKENSHVFVSHLLAGSMAEVASILVRYPSLTRNPFEVIKQQMQIGLDGKMSDVLRHIYRTRGIRG